MSSEFDAYHVWLGIPPQEQPPHYYRLLGISAFESSPKVIACAAQRQMAHVKSFAIGEYGEPSQKILNELAAAKLCLLNPETKARYDVQLRAQLEEHTEPAVERPPAGAPDRDRPAGEGMGAQEAIRTWVIGAAPDCDLVVERSTVSRRHCKLVRTPERLILEDLCSTNGTFVNGRRLAEPTPVSPLDLVLLGQKAPMPWPPELASPDVRVIRIGAAPDNDVVIDEPMVSSYHALIHLCRGRAAIVDLASTNGTAIDDPGSRLRRARLLPTQTVYLGSLAVPAARLLPHGLVPHPPRAQ